jgi:hypothetical protein
MLEKRPDFARYDKKLVKIQPWTNDEVESTGLSYQRL